VARISSITTMDVFTAEISSKKIASSSSINPTPVKNS